MASILVTDASFCPLSKAGGWAAYAESTRGSFLIGGPVVVGSVNSAEMSATFEGLRAAILQGVFEPGESFTLYTDSRYVETIYAGRSPRRKPRGIAAVGSARRGFLELLDTNRCTFTVIRIRARRPKHLRDDVHGKMRKVDEVSRRYMQAGRAERGYSERGEDLNGYAGIRDGRRTTGS
jgi:ribonuclease HI